ncbi:hypothetical protein ANN_22415, partial [Periplaneta americana]
MNNKRSHVIFNFHHYSSRHPKGQTSKGESSGGGKSLRERNENPSSQSSSDSSPIRKYAPKSRGVENTARAKRKRNTYKISEIIDKETITHIEKKGKFDAAPVSSENDSPDQEQMRETAYGFMVSERQPLLFEGGVLRPYQLDGLDWLKLLYENGVNGILADEMGLGKTLQVIALLCHLIEMHITGPFLVIAPLSTLPNWVLEFERFAPKILTPFLLRRVKADVALNIPPKKELLVYAPMSPVQLDLYRATVEHNYSKLFRKSEESLIIPDQPDGKRAKRKIASKRKSYAYDIVNSDDEFDEDSNPGSKYDIIINDKEDKDYKILLKMLHPMMQLRKIVNHPYLVHFPLVPGKKELRVDEELINKSGKLLVLDAMLVKLKERGHKILLFSTFTTLLDLLEEYVQMRDYRYVRLDGNVKLEDRQERIKLFNTDPDLFIFLISTRAGGLGINLTSADTVIIYDSDWNPQVDLQAQDRCHRIGQTRPVVVYRFVTAGTVDEQIVERAAAKRKLEKMVIQRGKFKLNQKGEQDHINLRELLDLLNSRDHQKVIHSNGY